MFLELAVNALAHASVTLETEKHAARSCKPSGCRCCSRCSG